MKRHVQNYTGTREALSRLFACKKYAALALAVSLWMAGGSVAAGAALHSLYITDDYADEYIYPSNYDPKKVSKSNDNKTLFVTGPWDETWVMFAGRNRRPTSGYTSGWGLNVNNADFKYDGVRLYGATVTPAPSFTMTPLKGHTAVISDSTFTSKSTIYGAYGENNSLDRIGCTLQENTVTIAGSSAQTATKFLGTATIYAVYEETRGETYKNTAKDNTVNLYGATAMENASLYGSGTSSEYYSRSGNELHLGGTRDGKPVNNIPFSPWQGYHLENGAVTATINNTVNSVREFEGIVLHKVNWRTTPALHAANGFFYDGSTELNGKVTLDISGMTFANSVPASGTMTLLSSGVANNFSTGLKLAYNNGGSATLSSSQTSQIVQAGTAASDPENGVTIGYQTGARSVSLADNFTKVNYTIHSDKVVDSITLGDITWNATTPARTLTQNAYNFSTANTVNTSALAFTNPDAVTGSMTLLSNATNLAVGADIAHTQNFTKTVNGSTLSATLSGNVTRAANTLGYTATGTTLNSINLAGWDGTAGSIPTGWAAKSGGVAVTAADFTEPTMTAGQQSIDIFTTTMDNFFGTVSGERAYSAKGTFSTTTSGVTLSGSRNGGVKAEDSGKKLTYYAEKADVADISLGAMAWGTGRDASGTGYDFAGVTTISASNLSFTNPEAVTGNMTLLSNATNLAAGKTVTGAAHTQNISTAINGAALSGTLTGTVATAAGAINYTVGSKTLSDVDLTGWNGTTATLTGWTPTTGGVAVTAGSTFAPSIGAGASKDILTATNEVFSNAQIAEAIQFKAGVSSSDTDKGVTLTGSESKGVKASDDGKKLFYERSNFNVNNIAFGEMTWGTARVASAGVYDYTNAAIDLSAFTFKNPENISAGTTTLLQANNTLANRDATEQNVSYSYVPVAGVTMDGKILGSYASSGGTLTYTATANTATKLTFGDVEWKDSGALMTRPANITFAGAAVDTTNINFTNLQSLEANKTMTLVSDFGNSVGTITGTKYKVGSTLEGEGKASLSGSDLIFTAETGAGMTVQEQTHNTVMSAEVGMAALSAGNDFVGTATEGLAMTANVGSDGVSSFANMGGGSIRQETGSHIDAHTWNAIIALGHQNKKERGTFEYGAFFEYGTGNYTTHNGDERGDGSTHYTGGGLLAKWRKPDGLYVEGSLRAGSVHDDARNVLRDANGVPYSYETNAPYFGGHIGVGKEITLANGNVVDVYGKYFYNRRNGVSFDAGGHYDLDAVTSQVLRIGARYTVKRSKWSFYAGAAYEHEMDGKAGGTADGLEIRGADTSGGSFRGEIGAIMTPGENSPVTLDFNLSGFAGKKQGFSGGVSVTFMI